MIEKHCMLAVWHNDYEIQLGIMVWLSSPVALFI